MPHELGLGDLSMLTVPAVRMSVMPKRQRVVQAHSSSTPLR